MSALASMPNIARPARHWAPAAPAPAPRPQLSVVKATSTRRVSIPATLVVVITLVAALAGRMFITMKMEEASYYMHNQEVALAALQDQQASLLVAVKSANSPQQLAARAAKLGLVPATAPGYISLQQGTVSGGAPAH